MKKNVDETTIYKLARKHNCKNGSLRFRWIGPSKNAKLFFPKSFWLLSSLCVCTPQSSIKSSGGSYRQHFRMKSILLRHFAVFVLVKNTINSFKKYCRANAFTYIFLISTHKQCTLSPNVNNSIVMVSLKNLISRRDSNPGRLILRRLQCPLSHATRDKSSYVQKNDEFTVP
jgi:hypothetical protein